MTTSPPRYPLEPLAAAAGVELGQIGGHQPGDPLNGYRALMEIFGVSRMRCRRWRTEGLTIDEADRCATHISLHPTAIWDSWARDRELEALPPAARANAVKEHCPQGHPYTHQDRAGARRCRWCETAKIHRFRAKTQVTQTVTPVEEAPAC